MTIDWTTLGLIVSMIVSLLSLGGVIVALRKAPHEIEQTDAQTDAITAETSQRYIEMANLAAERALKLDERIKTLEKENSEQSSTMRYMQGEINKLVVLNAKLSESNKKLEMGQKAVYSWAQKLSDQVILLNGIPIKPNFELPVE